MSANSHLDGQILSTLREVMGDDYGLLIETYINDSGDRLSAMAEGITNQDSELLRRTAHSFKGSSSNIGAFRLAEHCGVMENLALAGDLQSWPKQLAEIETEFAAVIRFLQ